MKRNYNFIWPEDFGEKLDGVYLTLHYSFREESFSQIESLYRDWVKKMLTIIDENVSAGNIMMAVGLERKQEIVKLLNSASVIANLATSTSTDVKINLFYKEFERFLSDIDLCRPLSEAPCYKELVSSISLLGQLAFLGAVGSAILEKNSEERDYTDLLKTLQAPYLRAIVRQYNNGVGIHSDKFSIYETAVTIFNENRFDTIKDRLVKVYNEFGLTDYVNGKDEVSPPAFIMEEVTIFIPSKKETVAPHPEHVIAPENKKEVADATHRVLDIGDEETVTPVVENPNDKK